MRPAGRYRLWTSGGPLVAVVLAVVHILVVADSHTAWRGDALWAIQQLGTSLALGLPVFVAVCALPPVLRGGARTDTELAPHSTARSRLYRVEVDSGPALAVHLAFVIAVLAYTGRHGSVFEWGSLLLTVGVQLLSLVVATALGRAVGEIGQHVAAVAVAALVGVLLAGFASNVFRVTAGDSSYAGLALSDDGYAASIAALAVAGLAVLWRHSWRVVSGVAVAATVLGVLVVSANLEEPSVEPSGARPTNCEPVLEVQACVFDGYDFMRDPMVDELRNVLQAMDKNRVDPHISRVEQGTPGRLERPGVVAVPFDRGALVTGDLRASAVRSVMLHPTWCPRVNSPQPLPAQFDRDQRTAFYWLSHVMGQIDDADYERTVPAFAARSADDQRAFVQDFLDRNATCEGLT